ncbi:hypothetical protein Tco_1139363 [Tanacetum coccineum]
MKQQKVKPKMDGLARPGASKGVSKRSHFQYSSASWIGEPSGQGTGEPGGQGTRGPVGLCTCWLGLVVQVLMSLMVPRGPSTRELGGPGTRGPGGLSSRDLYKSFTRSDTYWAETQLTG